MTSGFFRLLVAVLTALILSSIFLDGIITLAIAAFAAGLAAGNALK